ncbi:MAG: hypothetical protein A2Z35_03770 [Actinobacteria bacterium RBG_19FT_COMBO_36_27]|nr:MAG: hypothetical protein A2Z35_03770 [Actinobacteria bacterium RBG_19FT_COMBO_36_27]
MSNSNCYVLENFSSDHQTLLCGGSLNIDHRIFTDAEIKLVVPQNTRIIASDVRVEKKGERWIVTNITWQNDVPLAIKLDIETLLSVTFGKFNGPPPELVNK